MKPFFHTWSDVIPLNTVNEWYNVIWNNADWKFKGKTGYARESLRHWCSSVNSDIFHYKNEFELCDVERVVLDMWSCVKVFIDDVKPNLVPFKCIMNAYNFGDSSWIHTDCDQGETITCIVYINPFWDINWGGETFLVNDAKDTILEAVYPKPGRFILFDGRVLHGARPLSREAHIPRVGVTFQCRTEVV